MSPAIDGFLHEPARLAILSLLAPAESVDYGYLREAVGISNSAMSKHVSALADAGFVDVVKQETDRRGRRVKLTTSGRKAFDAYLDDLETIVARARQTSKPA